MDSSLDLYLELDKQSINQIKKGLVKEAVDSIYKTLKTKERNIQSFCTDKIKTYLNESPELISLTDVKGKLHAELGLPNAESDVQRLVNYIAESLIIEFNKINQNIEGSVEISLKQSKDLQDLYSQSFAFYETDKGSKIEWLKWLLEAGNQDVIFGYKIRYGVSLGRVGDAVMIKSKQANWRVPPEFSGTIDDNFITRALSNIETDLSQYIASILL